jgi:uncharacterized protein with NRDE domain
MCTVTFIPSRHRVFLTSNRDENCRRAPAAYPKAYEFLTGRIIFPKDGDGNGTWIALHENGNAIVFLNGGFVKHDPQPPYRKSRGLVLLDLIDTDSPFGSFHKLSFEQIEPFTAIILDQKKLYECRWDSRRKYAQALNCCEPHIWSSVTLYTPEVIVKRRQWFNDWLYANPTPTQEDILRFHQFTGDGDNWNDLRMNRGGETFTVSVTSLEIESAQSVIHYVDLKTNQEAITVFPIEKNTVTLK